MSEKKDALLGRWVHVSEEDTETMQVFRPADHPLPPSRGRAQLAFYPDRTVKAAGIGSNDVSQVTQGTWSGEGATGAALEITLGDGGERCSVELSNDGGPVLKLPKSP